MDLNNKKNDAKEIARLKWTLPFAELLNCAANYFNAKNTTSCSPVHVVIEFVVSETQCICRKVAKLFTIGFSQLSR